MESGALDLMLTAGPVVKGVLLVLLFFSVMSWAIILKKHLQLRRAEQENALFLRAFDSARNPKGLFSISKKYLQSPIANVFRATFAEAGRRDAQETRRVLKRYEASEGVHLERYLGFLATTGSSTPFIGLFGTVWGIMDSFMGIGSQGAASLAVVAPGIAEALIATAMGLVAAIPAVIAYNYYLSRARHIIIEMEDFSEEILDLMAEVQRA
ncbi:MAG: protein TolQ [Nitrospirota bacterium]|jgi:biopolymer transport protein TolQ